MNLLNVNRKQTFTAFRLIKLVSLVEIKARKYILRGETNS